MDLKAQYHLYLYPDLFPVRPGLLLHGLVTILELGRCGDERYAMPFSTWLLSVDARDP
jgi:hypothetical protein